MTSQPYLHGLDSCHRSEAGGKLWPPLSIWDDLVSPMEPIDCLHGLVREFHRAHDGIKLHMWSSGCEVYVAEQCRLADIVGPNNHNLCRQVQSQLLSA